MFKLLAIRPLTGCASEYRKSLKSNVIYKFHSNYNFVLEGKWVKDIILEPIVPKDIYNISSITNNEVEINISAIVGPNGAGKSSLLEFLFYAVFIIASKEKILDYNDIYIGEKIAKCKEERKKVEEKYWSGMLKKLRYIYRNINLELYYCMEKTIICVHINKGTVKQRVIQGDRRLKRKYKLESLKDDPKFDFGHFFYSICINYSVYGLNSKHIGDWINALFHKNDAYQTPLVINPMRNEGNYDINVETYLAQSRLISNLTDESMPVKRVVGDKAVEKIIFEIDEEKLEKFGILTLKDVINKFLKKENSTAPDIFNRIYEKILGVKPLTYSRNKRKVEKFDLIIRYTIKKVFKIVAIYRPYNDFHFIPTSGPPIPEIKDLDGLLNVLSEDHSHITLKLRQILNVVRYNLLREEKIKNIVWVGNSISLSVDEFSERIGKIRRYSSKIKTIEIVPVAFFNPVVYIKNIQESLDDKSNFHFLSSGEQQMVHSIQSIMYHLINLDSVFESGNAEKGKRKIEYKFINILLDEVELYFHPEFQRRFIYEIVTGIKQLKLNHIKGINLLFCTHSPYILSDIPSPSILRLKNGEIVPNVFFEQTFGANIHELLAKDFFMNEGFIGEWAKQQIFTLIDELNRIPDNSLPQKKIQDYYNKINIIGEPFLKQKLGELLEQKVIKDDMLILEIKDSEFRLKTLKSRLKARKK